MFHFIVRRLCLAALVAFTVSAVAFLLLYLAGDPAIALAGEGATEADVLAVRKQYGFDRPLPVQYLGWLSNALQGDFGHSFFFKIPVVELIAEKMPITLKLGLSSIVFAIVLSIPLGVLAAIKPNSIFDRLALLIAVIGQAMPSFWFGLMLIVVFSVDLRWLPASGSSSWLNFVLPTVVLGYYATPAIMRLTRAGMLEVLQSDYIRTARAKGLLPIAILFKHALRNAVIPVVGLAAVQLGFMLGGSVVVESVFALNGAGYLAYESISRNDFPVVQALILLFSLIFVLLTLLADLLNAWLDPRMRVH
ncbi:ABC transporter permease [Nitratireductor sp. XY-223]|uniref:ABC transporter permease n=1 Tax=Nitratireductor sp. XY-223 TaxID=2561926 RepID=UPI0010AAEBF3|nr:ABC transporter permease [Nitratireductor sp. XY-223]